MTDSSRPSLARLVANLESLSPRQSAPLVAQLELVRVGGLVHDKVRSGVRKTTNRWTSPDTSSRLLKSKQRIRSYANQPTVKDQIDKRTKELSGRSPLANRTLLRQELCLATGVKWNASRAMPRGIVNKMVDAIAPAFGVADSSADEDLRLKVLLDAITEDLQILVQEALKKMTPDQLRTVAGTIVMDAGQANEATQDAIKNLLGVRDLTIDNVTGVLPKLAMITIGQVGVSATGFAAYQAMTVIVHAVMTTFLGTTLPFAVYTSMTSALAFLVNPLTAVTLGVGVLGLRQYKAAKNFRKKIAGYVLLEIALTVVMETVPPSQPPRNRLRRLLTRKKDSD